VDGTKESYVKRDVYQVITDRVIGLLESGTVPWHKPWKGGNEAPQNFLPRKFYRGINCFLLHSANYTSPFWLTLKQVNAIGARVKKGERSFPVVFWKILEDVQEGETKRIPFLRYYSVFNLAQCEGIPVPIHTGLERINRFQPIQKCEQVVTNMPKRPKIVHPAARACYSPLHDEVSMPLSFPFESAEAYYSTLFHELTHSTGHLSRLGRKEVSDPVEFGSERYSREELVAEMEAAFLCRHCEIGNKTVDRSAEYIERWLNGLKDDRKLMVHAAAQAHKASYFILNTDQLEDEGPQDPQPKEFKVVALRDCPTPLSMHMCDTPQNAVSTHPHFDPERKCLVVLMLNTRWRLKGHHLVCVRTFDEVIIHPRDVFRTSIVATAGAIILMHNLCNQLHKLCYVGLRNMCSEFSAAPAFASPFHRKECCVGT
jgi:antirestriction protein ArdC